MARHDRGCLQRSKGLLRKVPNIENRNKLTRSGKEIQKGTTARFGHQRIHREHGQQWLTVVGKGSMTTRGNLCGHGRGIIVMQGLNDLSIRVQCIQRSTRENSGTRCWLARCQVLRHEDGKGPDPIHRTRPARDTNVIARDPHLRQEAEWITDAATPVVRAGMDPVEEFGPSEIVQGILGIAPRKGPEQVVFLSERSCIRKLVRKDL